MRCRHGVLKSWPMFRVKKTLSIVFVFNVRTYLVINVKSGYEYVDDIQTISSALDAFSEQMVKLKPELISMERYRR